MSLYKGNIEYLFLISYHPQKLVFMRSELSNAISSDIPGPF